jgi:hypothetical protein
VDAAVKWQQAATRQHHEKPTSESSKIDLLDKWHERGTDRMIEEAAGGLDGVHVISPSLSCAEFEVAVKLSSTPSFSTESRHKFEQKENDNNTPAIKVSELPPIPPHIIEQETQLLDLLSVSSANGVRCSHCASNVVINVEQILQAAHKTFFEEMIRFENNDVRTRPQITAIVSTFRKQVITPHTSTTPIFFFFFVVV